MKGAVNFNKHCLAHPEYNATENTFKCSKCNWKQNSYQELVKHLKNHTDNMMNVEEDMTATDNPTIIDDDNIVNQGQSILAESEFGVAGSFDDVDIDEMMDMNNTNHEIMQHEFAALPLSVAVYKSAVSNPDSSFIIWCKKLDADLIDVARLYPDRIFICVTGTKKQNPKSSQNTLVTTRISIGDGNEKDFKVTLYSTTQCGEKRHFSSIEDFQKALLLHSKFHKMEHYVRQSFRDLQILNRMDRIKLIICNSVGHSQQL